MAFICCVAAIDWAVCDALETLVLDSEELLS